MSVLLTPQYEDCGPTEQTARRYGETVSFKGEKVPPTNPDLPCVMEVYPEKQGQFLFANAMYSPEEYSVKTFLWNNRNQYFRPLGELKDLWKSGHKINAEQDDELSMVIEQKVQGAAPIESIEIEF